MSNVILRCRVPDLRMSLCDGVILFLQNMLEVTDWDKKNGNLCSVATFSIYVLENCSKTQMLSFATFKKVDPVGLRIYSS